MSSWLRQSAIIFYFCIVYSYFWVCHKSLISFSRICILSIDVNTLYGEAKYKTKVCLAGRGRAVNQQQKWDGLIWTWSLYGHGLLTFTRQTLHNRIKCVLFTILKKGLPSFRPIIDIKISLAWKYFIFCPENHQYQRCTWPDVEANNFVLESLWW